MTNFKSIIENGDFIRLNRGKEWVVIQACYDYDDNNEASGLSNEKVTWMYGNGVVGKGCSVHPMAVVDSQIQAHIEHGWVKQ